MDWFSILQQVMGYAPLLFAFIFGIGAGSFVNVMVARLPFDKSIIWPSSHCFSCLTAIRAWHNVPLLGYLLLRGRCANCKASFSSRYFWIELITGIAFVLIYILTVMTQTVGGPSWLKPWFDMPGMQQPFVPNDSHQIIKAWSLWATYCCLFTLLLAASLIDAEHRIIPTSITYPGTIIGIIAGMLMPWPWPSDPQHVMTTGKLIDWCFTGRIVHGLQIWPALGPPPEWAPAGTWQMGLLNSLTGAAVGMMSARLLKFVYESLRNTEALGLGDADLLMMIGAFLGWQIAIVAMPFGAVFTLIFVAARWLYKLGSRKDFDPILPFGPGIAMGAGFAWLVWPRFSELMRTTFDLMTTIIMFVVIYVAIGAVGLILRGRGQSEEAT